MRKRKKIKKALEIIELSLFSAIVSVGIIINGMFVYKRRPEDDEIKIKKK